jgi:xylitol oxidase
MKNWSGNIEYRPAEIARPESISELQKVVADSRKVRAYGSGHSFNTLADTDGTLIAFSEFDKNIEIDSSKMLVRVPAGVRYGEVAPKLHANGFALRNMGSLPHITVVGATSTGTHGSGVGNKNLSGSIAEIELITATGDAITLDQSELPAARVALGSIGIIHHLTLDIVPTYDVAQTVYFDLPFVQLISNLDAILSAGYSVSVLSMWGDEFVDQVWVKSKIGTNPVLTQNEWFGAKLATRKSNPIREADSAAATEQFGLPGPWFERLPHFKLDFTPSFGEELQTEYFIDRKDAPAALNAIYKIREELSELIMVCEMRTVAQDENWLSEAYGRETFVFHFTWRPNIPAVEKLLLKIEASLEPFKARPHWGKVFTNNAFDFSSLYPKFNSFLTYRGTYDPSRKFVNKLLETWGF